jgi:hypothetical protein
MGYSEPFCWTSLASAVGDEGMSVLCFWFAGNLDAGKESMSKPEHIAKDLP